MKYITKFVSVFLIIMILFASVVTVSATETNEETTEKTETTTVKPTTTKPTTTKPTTTKPTTTKADNTKIWFDFVGKKNSPAEYAYTGSVIHPEIVVMKSDGTKAKPNEYTVKYDGDCKSLGAHHITVTYKKNNYRIMDRFDIVPGYVKKINVKYSDNSATLSWNAVPGATHYRVYTYEKGHASELYWSNGSISSSQRSYTIKGLKKGVTYKFGVMALANADSMPTSFIKTVSVKLPEKDSVEKTTLTVIDTTKTTDSISTTFDVLSTQVVTEDSLLSIENTTVKTDDVVSTDSTQNESSNAKLIVAVVAAVAVVGIAAVIIIKKKK